MDETAASPAQTPTGAPTGRSTGAATQAASTRDEVLDGLTNLIPLGFDPQRDGVSDARQAAERIVQSAWFTDQLAAARGDGARAAACYFRDMSAETFTRREVIDLLDYLAGQYRGAARQASPSEDPTS